MLQGEALQGLQAAVQQATAQDWRPLPASVKRAAAFQEAVNALVLDVLMDKVSMPFMSRLRFCQCHCS